MSSLLATPSSLRVYVVSTYFICLTVPSPLPSMTHFFDRAERIFFDQEIVTSTVGGGLERTTYGDWAERSRRLGGVLDNLGLEPGARVGSFAVRDTDEPSSPVRSHPNLSPPRRPLSSADLRVDSDND